MRKFLLTAIVAAAPLGGCGISADSSAVKDEPAPQTGTTVSVDEDFVVASLNAADSERLKNILPLTSLPEAGVEIERNFSAHRVDIGCLKLEGGSLECWLAIARKPGNGSGTTVIEQDNLIVAVLGAENSATLAGGIPMTTLSEQGVDLQRSFSSLDGKASINCQRIAATDPTECFVQLNKSTTTN